jgi:hypothetical protein
MPPICLFDTLFSCQCPFSWRLEYIAQTQLSPLFQSSTWTVFANLRQSFEAFYDKLNKCSLYPCKKKTTYCMLFFCKQPSEFYSGICRLLRTTKSSNITFTSLCDGISMVVTIFSIWLMVEVPGNKGLPKIKQKKSK